MVEWQQIMKCLFHLLLGRYGLACLHRFLNDHGVDEKWSIVFLHIFSGSITRCAITVYGHTMQ